MSWGQMLFGAFLSALLAAVVAGIFFRERRPLLLAFTSASAFFMPIFWNSILNWTGATGQFSHDLPLAIFPISWQDAGSGIFSLAGAAVAVLLVAGRDVVPRHLLALVSTAAFAALVVDVYAY